MKELKELVELADKSTLGEWTTDTRGGVIAVNDQANNGFVICTVSGGDKSHNSSFIAAANPEKILAIAEAFRALEQRAEAAEAKLAELEKQEPAGKWIVRHSPTEDGYDRFSFASWRGKEPKNNTELFTRPAPAINLSELVPDEKPDLPDNYSDTEWRGMCDGWNACRATILRNIEEQSK